MNNSNWFLFPKKVNRPSMRLFCFPYAGGGASVFREWTEILPDDVELGVMELPGRGRRFSEPLISSLSQIIGQLANAISQYVDTPFVFFGHSIGSLISFELAKELRRRGTPIPEMMIVSGKKAPQIPNIHNFHKLPDDELLVALKKYNGTPISVLQNEELMSIFLPVLRSDFSLAETYNYNESKPFDMPISAFGGVDDDGVPSEELLAWEAQTSQLFTSEFFPGDHFFIQNKGKEKVQERVSQLLYKVLSELRRSGSIRQAF